MKRDRRGRSQRPASQRRREESGIRMVLPRSQKREEKKIESEAIRRKEATKKPNRLPLNRKQIDISMETRPRTEWKRNRYVTRRTLRPIVPVYRLFRASLARSAQAERDNESCFFVRASGVHLFIRRYHV
ncbi:hypothetical protein EVAR_12840_1 [Eumeta japonica]|uniref:Uncharacterized protein n=1 Tax=Eumeta variegata TaxID=151549 RepID=A0A4C1UBQ7_EUMVA|nr:hypothetical protein EVAR_12840_1 [Eumeta japonica]